VRIAIIDDHPIFRAGLRKLLESEPGIEIVAEAGSPADAANIVDAHRPDLLLLDFTMPTGTALDVLRQLGPSAGSVKPVILTASISRDQVVEALRLGAVGILLKSSAAELLFQCIRVVMEGQYWVDRGSAADLVSAMRSQETGAAGQPQLSQVERRMLEQLALGAPNKMIARDLGVAEQTVKNHLSKLYERFDVGNRMELISRVRQLGLISRN
jgi:DNA-binding NarL/FixJ family response regulator